MSGVLFNSQQCVDTLDKFEVPATQAQGHALVLTNLVSHLAEVFVTRDYLDMRLQEQSSSMEQRFTAIDLKFADIEQEMTRMRAEHQVQFNTLSNRLNQLFYMVGLGFTVLIIPLLKALF